MKLLRILPLVVSSAVAGTLASISPAHALNWNWSYSNGVPINAAGTFITTDTPDVSGFYTITAITGNRNSIPITLSERYWVRVQFKELSTKVKCFP